MADYKALILTLVRVAASSAHLGSPRPDWPAVAVSLKRLYWHARSCAPLFAEGKLWRHNRSTNRVCLKFSRRYERRWVDTETKIGPMDLPLDIGRHQTFIWSFGAVFFMMLIRVLCKLEENYWNGFMIVPLVGMNLV